MLAPVHQVTDARRGEGPSKPWKPTTQFSLQDEEELEEDEVEILSVSPSKSDKDEGSEDER